MRWLTDRAWGVILGYLAALLTFSVQIYGGVDHLTATRNSILLFAFPAAVLAYLERRRHASLHVNYKHEDLYLARVNTAQDAYQHRIGILTPPNSESAENVRVEILGMKPRPANDGGQEPQFPHTLFDISMSASAGGLDIPTGQERRWLFGETATGPDGVMRTSNLSTYPRTGGYPWTFDPKVKRWTFICRVLSANRRPKKFRIVLTPVSGVLRCEVQA